MQYAIAALIVASLFAQFILHQRKMVVIRADAKVLADMIRIQDGTRLGVHEIRDILAVVKGYVDFLKLRDEQAAKVLAVAAEVAAKKLLEESAAAGHQTK